MVRWLQINGLAITMLMQMDCGNQVDGFNPKVNGGIDIMMVLILQMILK